MLKVMIGPCAQLGDVMFGEKSKCASRLGGFRCDGFHTVSQDSNDDPISGSPHAHPSQSNLSGWFAVNIVSDPDRGLRLLID